MRSILRQLVFLFPASELKNLCLRRLGLSVGVGARIGVVLADGRIRFAIGSHARVSSGNSFRGLSDVILGDRAFIGPFNKFSANPGLALLNSANGSFRLDNDAYVTNRHLVDCSGGVIVERFAAIAGVRSIIQSHAIDFEHDAQTAGKVVVGSYSFIGSNCTLLMGTGLPSRSILAAGSVLTKDLLTATEGLYAGVPARFVKAVDGAWFNRTSGHSRDVLDVVTGHRIVDAF